jgi:hypothetical protein
MIDHISRNIEIIRAYLAGRTMSDLARDYNLTRGRIYQILKDIAKVRRASERDAFLGVNVTSDTRDALKRVAKERGVSVSKLASDALDEVVR